MDLTDVKYIFKHLLELQFQKKADNKEQDWYYFMHIPKTAGASLRYALFEQFAAHQIYPNNVDYYFKDQAKYIPLNVFRERQTDLIKPDIRLLMGHFGVYPIQNVRKKPPKTFAFFRNPVKRVVSALNYNSKKGRPYYGLSLEEKIEQCRVIEGSMMARNLGYQPKKDNIDAVLKNLEKIDIVCITEYFNESIQLINQIFGWSLPLNVHRNKRQENTPLSEGYMEEIRAFCKADQLVYERAKELFFKACEVKGISLRVND